MLLRSPWVIGGVATAAFIGLTWWTIWNRNDAWAKGYAKHAAETAAKTDELNEALDRAQAKVANMERERLTLESEMETRLLERMDEIRSDPNSAAPGIAPSLLHALD